MTAIPQETLSFSSCLLLSLNLIKKKKKNYPLAFSTMESDKTSPHFRSQDSQQSCE